MRRRLFQFAIFCGVATLGWWWFRSAYAATARQNYETAFATAEASLKVGDFDEADAAWRVAQRSASWAGITEQDGLLLDQYQRESHAILNLLDVSPTALLNDDGPIVASAVGKWIILDTTAVAPFSSDNESLSQNRLSVALLGPVGSYPISLGFRAFERTLIDANPTRVVVAAQIVADAGGGRKNLSLNTDSAFLWTHAAFLRGSALENRIEDVPEFLRCLDRQAMLLGVSSFELNFGAIPAFRRTTGMAGFAPRPAQPESTLDPFRDRPNDVTRVFWKEGVTIIRSFRDGSSSITTQRDHAFPVASFGKRENSGNTVK